MRPARETGWAVSVCRACAAAQEGQMAFKTQYQFRLPRGYVDEEGNLHRDGVMRLATARDEILPLQDYRVQSNRAYLVIVLLSRVITKLGDITNMGVDIIENLFS